MKKCLLSLIIALSLTQLLIGQVSYTFTGNGNWSDSSNWLNKLKPPLLLADSSIININPVTGGTCLLNVSQTISKGTKITVLAGKNLKIPGSLIIQSQPTLSIKAADVSFLPSVRLSGIVTKNSHGTPEDMLTTLQNAGVNTIRLRLWKKPTDPLAQYASFTQVKALAQEIKSKGMRVWLTVHYSDTWADPSHQSKPAEWASANLVQLGDSVYEYTKKIVTEINPDIIQIGNEVNGGFLWPEGAIANFSQFTGLLKQGVQAVRDYAPGTKIVIHFAGPSNAVTFYKNLGTLSYDYMGISYYPMWHGQNLDTVQSQLNVLGTTIKKKVLIAETAYPFTLGYNDYTTNTIGSLSQLISTYPPTPKGQFDYLTKIEQIALNTTNGIGFCYWGGEWISFMGPTATNGSTFENAAFWDFTNQALPVLDVYKK